MNTRKIIFTYGLLFGGLSVGLSLVQFFGGFLYQNTIISRIIFGIIPIFLMLFCIGLGIYFAQRAFRKEKITFSSHHHFRFSQMLKIGMGITLVGALLIAVYQVVLITYLDTQFLQKTMELQLEQQQALYPEMTEKELLQVKQNMQKSSTPFMQFNLSLVSNLFFGFFISLGMSALMKLTQKRF